MGKKATLNKENTPQTPQEKKTSPPELSPDAPAKRRKVDEVKVDGKAVAAPVQTTLTGGIVTETSTAATGDTGPWSLWSGPAGDPKGLSSPAFDPSSMAEALPVGKAVPFSLISDALSEIEKLKGSGQGSRKKMTVILSNLFRVLLVTRPADVVPAVYIISNRVAPDYELDSELGIGDQTILRAMGETFGRSEKQMKETLNSGQATDLGEVALLSRVAQKMLMMPAKLTIEKVFTEMKALSHSSGKDSQKAKKEKIQKMLVASRGEEAKFIVRMLQSKLRIGIQTPTVMQAIAYAFTLTTAARGDVAPVNDIRKGPNCLGASVLAPRMEHMENAVKRAYCEMPNFDMLLAALMDGCNATELAARCSMSLGIPVKPMLAKPSKGIGEVVQRLTGKRFTGEWKYDGERAQIHVLSKDNIMVFSRNSENMTEKYPDVIQVIKDTLCDDVQSCVIDSELVAYDQETKKILPFQVLSTRGKKNVEIVNIKVNVCVFAFDCMLHNGRTMVADTLEERRLKLWKTLKETEGKVKFATYFNFDDLKEEEIQTFLDESIAGSCEGLMLKTLVDDATYQPSKRSLNWLKLKKDYIDGLGDSLDVVPIGAFYGKGKRSGAYGAYLLAVWNPEEEEYQTVCKAGTGFSDEDLITHHKFFQDHILPKADSSYHVSDKIKPDVWLDARQVWEIKCADLSISPVHTSAFGQKADGKGIGLRFPRFLRIREDKKPEESTGPDQIVDMFESQASVGTGGGPRDDDDF